MIDHSALIERLEGGFLSSNPHHSEVYQTNTLLAEAAAALRDQQAQMDRDKDEAHAVVHAAIMLMGVVGTAFYDGFRDAIGKEPWDDCYDYAAVKGRDYALEKMKAYRDAFPLPSAPNQAKEAGE